MATIKRPIKVYNGSSWDEIHAKTDSDMVVKDDFSLDKTNFNKFFGAKMSSDVIHNNPSLWIAWDGTNPGFTKQVDYAEVNSSKKEEIHILKTGYYLISARVKSSDLTGNTHLITSIDRVSNGTTDTIAIASYDKQWSEGQGSIAVFSYLEKGQVIRVVATRIGSGAFRIDAKETNVCMFPIYIP